MLLSPLIARVSLLQSIRFNKQKITKISYMNKLTLHRKSNRLLTPSYLHIAFSRYDRYMDMIKTLKALNNEKRLQILEWLKEPENNFPPHNDVPGFEQGVCVSNIQDKLGLSQSATSQYMSMLEDANLVISTRIGKWTYYRRNDDAIQQFGEHLRDNL